MFQLDKVLEVTYKNTVKTKEELLRQRSGSHLCAKQLVGGLQYMQDLEAECIWSIALNLESVAGSSRFWHNILVFFLLEERERVVAFQPSSQF